MDASLNEPSFPPAPDHAEIEWAFEEARKYGDHIKKHFGIRISDFGFNGLLCGSLNPQSENPDSEIICSVPTSLLANPRRFASHSRRSLSDRTARRESMSRCFRDPPSKSPGHPDRARR